MKTLNNHLAGLKTRGDFRELQKRSLQDRPHTNASELPPQHPIWDVWQQIKWAYPGPTANWDAEPPMIWAYAIDGLTDEQVANGVRNLVRRDSEFPPNAGQFRDLCLTDMEWEHRRLKYIDTSDLIEDKTQQEARAAANLEAIRKLRRDTGL